MPNVFAGESEGSLLSKRLLVKHYWLMGEHLLLSRVANFLPGTQSDISFVVNVAYSA